MDQTEIEEKHHLCQFDFQTIKEGIRFDKYCLFQEIGGGAQAKVYLGKNTEDNKKVAIKVLDKRIIEQQPNFNKKKKERRLLKEESRIMMKVQSENVLKCYECFQSDIYKFMIIEFCNEGTLFDKLTQKQKFPEHEAIAFFKQIVHGISACHQKKIIHRDIKLENIFVHNGVCKVADFGYSKVLQIQDQQETTLNTSLGNFDAMAPEVRSIKPYGFKADIWSLGVIFYQMIFGLFPFRVLQVSEQGIQNYLNKRIKEINESQIINGVKPSVEVKKLLKETLVVDQSQRIGWNQLLQHQIFKQKKQGLKPTFTRPTNLKSSSQILEENQKKQIKPKIQQNQKQYVSIRRLEKQKNAEQFHKSDKSRVSQIVDIRQLNKNYEIKKIPSRIMLENQIEEEKKKINREEDIFYRWADFIHNQCLRAEFIFQKIIKTIEKHKLLDITKEQSLRLMYLLCTRCRNNISPINFEYQKRKNSKVIAELNEIVTSLYKNIQERWNYYHRKLGPKQQKYASLKDWYKNVVESTKFNEDDKFFAGIEDMTQYKPQEWQKMQRHKNAKKQQQLMKCQGLSDYTKMQQIQFTLKHIEANLNNLKQSQKTEEIRSYLKGFKEICSFDEIQEKPEDFKDLLEQIGLSFMKKKR